MGVVSDEPPAGSLGSGAAEPRGAPRPPRRGGRDRSSRPERGKPGGIYGPDGVRLPDGVSYIVGRKRFRAELLGVRKTNRESLEEACADAAQVRAERAQP